MKMSTFAIALTLTAASVQSMAQDVVLKPVNNDFETQACYIAATEGYIAAKTFIRSNGVNFTEFKNAVTCNNQDIKTFASLYSGSEEIEDPTILAIVAKDADAPSKACAEAVNIGASEALAKYNLTGEKIFCNHREIEEFVRQYNSEDVIVRDIAED